ncbi:MAG: DUF2782 domain-containing protein [Mariprofundaceae bacterium]|nr:DUF2782 domain-containing protein [Mariprofundaceae bacterium]
MMLYRFCLPLAFALLTWTSFAHAESLQDLLTPQQVLPEVQVQAYQHQNGATISEYRLHGKVWMIKIQPVGDFPAYYLYDPEGEGSFERRIAGNTQPTPPMWVIKKF